MADGKKPTAAFVLVLIGGILILLYGLFTAAVGATVSTIGTVAQSSAAGLVGGSVVVLGAIGIIIGIILIVSSLMINTTDRSKVQKWSIVALILALISLIDGGGFIIGFILTLIGSILGLVYKG